MMFELGNYHEKSMMLMKRALIFLEKQLGVQVEGTSQWKRSNGALVDGHELLIDIRKEIARLNFTTRDLVAAIACMKEVRQMLELRDKSDDSTLQDLVEAERRLSIIYSQSKQFGQAEYHCQQCLIFSKLVKGENQIPFERRALANYANCKEEQSLNHEAIAFFENAYILASGAYGCVHCEVQEAASNLIDCLLNQGDYSRADGYCRMNYDNLTDPRNGIDQESDEVCHGMFQICCIWLKKDPVKDEKEAIALGNEAEDLIRKSTRLYMKRKSLKNYGSIRYYRAFGEILLKRSQFTEETRTVLERYLYLARDQNGRIAPIGDSDMKRSLQFLAVFYSMTGVTTPSGEVRTCDMQLLENYQKEYELHC